MTLRSAHRHHEDQRHMGRIAGLTPREAAEDHEASARTVRRLVAGLRRGEREVTVPLVDPLG